MLYFSDFILQRQMSVPSFFFRGAAFCREHSASERKAVWERYPWTWLVSSYFSKTALLFEGLFFFPPQHPRSLKNRHKSVRNPQSMAHFLLCCISCPPAPHPWVQFAGLNQGRKEGRNEWVKLEEWHCAVPLTSKIWMWALANCNFNIALTKNSSNMR